MKKVDGEQDFSGVRPRERGWHRWKFQDKVTRKIVPNISNLFYAVFKLHVL